MYFPAKRKRAGRHGYLAALAALCCATTVAQSAEPKSRIRYAEPVAIAATAMPRSAKLQPAGVPAIVAFDAFGHRFVLELESNDRLLRRLPAARRAELPSHDLYRGRIAGIPGSWVRLTRLPDGLYGAIWDGNEVYSIIPAHAAAEFMGGTPPPTSDQSLIYRASDVDLLVGPGFCTVLDPSGRAGPHATGLEQYKALLRELPRQAATSAAVATLELEVAMIGDYEFYSMEPDATGALLSRLNIVDGIFSQQVGVAIVASEIKVFDTAADPFTTAAAGTLLQQVGSYRASTPVIAAAGLAHLVTGRDLTGDTVGIAYIAGVCENEIGVSLSERWFDEFTSALIAAHEFGHNFGAPHDGETGSPCQSTGPGYLMWPELSGNSTFSQCSISQMQPVIAASACLRQRQYVDIAVEVPQDSFVGYTTVPLPIAFDLVNRGTRSAERTDVTLYSASGSVVLEDIVAEGGSCTSLGRQIDCQFGPIAAGHRRHVEINFTSPDLQDYTATITAVATNDVNSENDASYVSVDMRPATTIAITALPTAEVTVLKLDEFELSYQLRVDGVRPLVDGISHTAAFSTGITALSATAQGGVCTVEPDGPNSIASCRFDSIAPGEVRTVRVRMRGDRVGVHELRHWLTGSAENATTGDANVHYVRVNPLVDLVIRADTPSLTVPKGGAFSATFTVLSLGPNPARLARVHVRGPGVAGITGLLVQGATCEEDTARDEYLCRFQLPIESGETRRLDVTMQATMNGTSNLEASVICTDNEHFDGPYSTYAEIPIDVREATDVRNDYSFDVYGYDNRPIVLEASVTSSGLSPAAGAHLAFDLPANLRALEVAGSTGGCVIAHPTVRCDFGTLQANQVATVRLVLQASAPGRYEIVTRAGADNDLDPGNNTRTMLLDAQPNIDLALDALPPATSIKTGRTSTYRITARTASQPVDNVSVMVNANLAAEVVGVTSATGTCGPHDWWPGAYVCVLGTVPANTGIAVDAELLGLEAGNSNIEVQVQGDFDIDSENNRRVESLTVLAPGSARVSAPAQTTRQRVGDRFSVAGIAVEALADTEAVAFRVRIPDGLTPETALPDQGECEIAAQVIDCRFGNLGAGFQRTVTLQLRAERAGTFRPQVELTTEDDSEPGDNAASFVIEVASAQPPPPPDEGSGGGGGGSLDWTLLMFGAAAFAIRRRRRPPTSALHAGQVHSGQCPDGSGHC